MNSKDTIQDWENIVINGKAANINKHKMKTSIVPKISTQAIQMKKNRRIFRSWKIKRITFG